MKVMVLEHPRIPSEKRFNDIANTPLWSCLMGGYAASSLEAAGFDTVFVDHAVAGMFFETTREKVNALGPELLCINAVYFWEHTSVLFDFLGELKQDGFSGHISLFGFFPTLVYRKILGACEYIDSIAVGEFEHTLTELARALSNGTALDKIEGLALASCLADRKNRARKPGKDPDIFPFPRRANLGGTVTVLASRGCYNHCSFCPVPSFYNQGSLWRGRRPENIFREMQELTERGVSRFYFADPNFIGPGRTGKKRTMDLMELIRPMGITFGMETRPQDLTDEVLEKLVASGFTSLLMGIESGSKNILNLINKTAETSVGAEAIALCRKHGIEPEIGFLMFVPDSSLDDLHRNMAFLMENHLLDRLDRTANLLCHSQIVLAGTSGYTQFERSGRLKKSGVFDFEAEVSFSDPRVEWMSELVMFACHTVLRSMSDKASPIFWENGDNSREEALNAFLLESFFTFLSMAEKHHCIPPGEIFDLKQSVLAKINALLKPDAGGKTDPSASLVNGCFQRD